MATFTELPRNGEFILTESNGYRSRGEQDFDSATDFAGEAIPAGTVYSLSGTTAVPYDGAAAAGILVYTVPAGGVVMGAAAVVRDAEVKLGSLTYTGVEADLIEQLALIGIVARS